MSIEEISKSTLPDEPCTDAEIYECDGKNCHIAKEIRRQAATGDLTPEGWQRWLERTKQDPHCVHPEQIEDAANTAQPKFRTED